MIHLSTASFTWREAAGDRLWPAGPVEICLFRKNSGKNIRCQIQYSKWAGGCKGGYVLGVQIKKVGVTRPGFPVRPAALQGSFQGTLPLG